MGLLQRLFKKKKNREQNEVNEQELKVKEGIYRTTQERTAFVKNCCDLINEARRQCLEAKKEYEVVTSYLADIQRIDMFPAPVKHSVTESARKVVSLNQERQKMQKVPPKITVAQRLALEPYEATIRDEIRRMEENEEYLGKINSDIRQLEGEKAALDYEIDEILDRDEMGRKVFKTSAVFLTVFLIFLFMLQEIWKKNIQIPFLLAVSFGILLIAYFYFSNRKNQYDLKVAEIKKNRAILLLNKVKIKFVNCTNLLDYSYEKFHVANSRELHYHWTEYMRIVEEERRFKKVTDMIELYNHELVQTLKQNGIQDAEIWTYQPEAIVDPKEMVEVRHRLNVRRQKLRQRIDYNNNQEDTARRSLRSFRESNVDFDTDTLLILARNEIEP